MHVLTSGPWIGAGQGWASFGLGPTVTLTVLDNKVAQTPVPDGRVPESPPIHRGESPGTYTLRVIWASWGMDYGCEVTVNGFHVPAVQLDPSRAMQARLEHFVGVASADTGIAGAGAALSHQREVDGYVFNWFYATGSASSRSPDGESGGDARTFFAGDSTGTWEYAMTAGYGAMGSPRAFLLETPR
jgi:hypothetical protein